MEAAVILPLLVLLVLAVVEVGDSLSKYYSLNQALREAVLSVSGHPCQANNGVALTDANIPVNEYERCMSDPPTLDLATCQTYIAGYRVLRLLESLGLRSVFQGATLSIALTSGDLNGINSGRPCARAVSLSGSYRPSLTGLFSNQLQVTTRAVGGGRGEGP